MNRNCPIVLAIDFDETIVFNEPFPNIKGVLPKADYYINKLYEEGYYIIINTCRYGQHEHEAVEYLKLNSIPFHLINAHHPDLITFYGNDTRKISADIYIDDKNLDALPDWEGIYLKIKNRQIVKPILSVLNK